MQGTTTYLNPGFLVTLVGQRGSINFTQIPPGPLRRGAPFRLTLVDALSRGYHGELDSLLSDLAQKHDVPVQRLRKFVTHLGDSGFLTDNPPAACFRGPLPDAPGAPPTTPVTITTPLTLIADGGQYLWYNHQGEALISLSMAEVVALSMFAEPATVEEAQTLYFAENSHDGLDSTQFDSLVRRLSGAGLFVEPAPAEKSAPAFRPAETGNILPLVDARVAAHDESLANKGLDLLQVVPVNTDATMAPAALGLLMAYAMEYEDGHLRDKYNFVPMFLTDETRLLERAATPGIFLFSNYLWDVENNLRLSAVVKAVNPRNITVHGGPSTPSYEKDCEQFFIDNPHVDITVRGEGELTFAEILTAFDGNCPTDLDVLQDVDGLTYRTGNGVHRTGNRERIADLNTIPSPYLMGLFEEFGSVGAGAIIESNRGCPYGCTFCDWGSATLTKVRRFDLDRVFKELEWSATHQIKNASFADANFGMLERDVEITEKIVELKKIHGFPRSVAINYAKNKVQHLRQIIELMSNAGLFAEGVVSLQSTDETTLKVIERSNIRLDKYDELSIEFRKARLPLAADIMMGLPGSTPISFRTDLQRCTDRDIRVRANGTLLLPNSPMNEPGYRKKYGIVAAPGEVVKETTSYTRAQWDEMEGLRLAYYIFESYGVLRYVARYVRRETGIGEVEYYDRIQSQTGRDFQQWPMINTVAKYLNHYMAPPGSWSLFIDEIHRFAVENIGMADDSGLRTALKVQLAHLPAPHRVFPDVLQLEHDYVAWQSVVFEAREEGHRDDWEKHVPRLSEFGPTTLTVEDPEKISVHDIGQHKNVLDHRYRTWELSSPLARPRLGAIANAV